MYSQSEVARCGVVELSRLLLGCALSSNSLEAKSKAGVAEEATTICATTTPSEAAACES